MPLILSGSSGLSGNVGTTTKEMLPAGSVLQVVQALKTDLFSTTSTSFVDVAGWAASITPLSASSKILVLADAYVNTSNTANAGKLQRNGVDVFLGNASGSKSRSSFGAAWGGGDGGGGNAGSQWSLSFLDSPNTTASLTYKIVVASFGGQALWVGGTYGSADASYSQVLPTTITLMEIKG
jgi:hypothetical protein